MPAPSDFYSAFVPVKDGDKQRAALTERIAYRLHRDESAQDLIATDAQSGAVIGSLLQNGRIFELDPDDTTTAHDGTSVLVSADGLRYKLDDLGVPYAVLASDITSPPVSPSIGDAYLLIDPGTGDWAGLGPIVTYTSRGWESIEVEPGRLIYDEDGDQYYRVDSNGDILPGFGEGSISPGTLSPRHFLRDGDLFRFIVENQTTNTPPGSPTAGLSYIAGSSPTGAWTTPGYIYRYEADEWREYAPRTGWVAYDKAQSLELIWNGSAWVNAAGGFTNQQSFSTAGAHTWNKPAYGTWAQIEVWGGGGSGGVRSGTGDAGGGGGGAYKSSLPIRMAHLPSTLSVTVGAGGAARTGASNQNGEAGGASSVAVSGLTIVTAGGGASGGQGAAGAGATGGVGGDAGDAFGDSGSAGGNVLSNAGQAVTATLRSGAGGGATGSSSASAGGVSRLGGGNGGAAFVNSPGANGIAPGGGGGGSRLGNASGAGAEGRVVITVW